MAEGEAVLFHSVLSPLLNIGLLQPRECVDAAVAAYDAGRAPIESVEGFVRQIIGWREFINGVYWHTMPGYVKHNALDAHAAAAEVDLHRRDGHELPAPNDPPGRAHGLQSPHPAAHGPRQFLSPRRVRAAGGAALVHGDVVDAHDWVMAANVIGMILHADGGYMATKPYAAGAATSTR